MRILYLFILSLLVFSCSKQPDKAVEGLLGECSVIASKKVTNGGDTVVVCDASSVKESVVIPLSKLVDSLEIVRLENLDMALVKPVCVEVADNYIGVNCYSSYKLFTRKGKYLTDIGRKGQGPGEYWAAYDSQIDEKNDRIYLMPWRTKNLYVYDLKGTFLNAIPLPYLTHKAVIKVNVKERQLSVLQLPFGEGNEPLAWTQDFEGRIIHENHSGYLDLWPDYSNEIPVQKVDASGRYLDFYLYASLPRVDSLYHYDTQTNRCIPKFTVSFPSELPPRHVLYEFRNYYMADVVQDNPYDWKIDYRLLVDKSTLKGGRFKVVIDQLGGIPWVQQNDGRGPGISSYDYFINFIEPGKLQSLIEEQLAHHKDQIPAEILSKVMAFNNSISEDDNCYILLGKWKNNEYRHW